MIKITAVDKGLREMIFYFAMKCKGNFAMMKSAIASKEKIEPNLIAEYKKQRKYKSVTLVDNNYPEIYKS